ncbi:MAG: nitrilase-related carbon-nitrogen hydrolase [Planctomycetota bacterium]
MQVGAYQFDVQRGDFGANLAQAIRGVEAAAEAELALVVLPELWPTSFPAHADASPAFVEPSLRAVEVLARRAAELGVAVAGSAFAPSPEAGERPRNRLHLLVEEEDRLGFDKLHLFSPTGEPLAFSSGEAPPRVASVADTAVGGVVCYDLRFAAPLEFLAAAELVVVPAQWPEARARHWRALLVGRAVELQAYVLGANRVGEESLGRTRKLVFAGGSALVAPDGEVLSELGQEAGLVAGEVDSERVRRVRRAVPVARDRRSELYDSWRRQGS